MDNEYYKRYEPFFGSWHIKRFIGAGSYGKVFEIERRDFDMVFTGALKAITIPADKSEYEQVLEAGMDREGASTYFRDYVQELNREIALMSRLKGHSNIVSYEDHQIIPHEDGIGWDILIRMELLKPINDALRQNKSFTRAEVIRLGTDLCRALEVCGQYNIIHRDIKPANIFISDTGDYKLGDFGVARIASASTGASTRAGTVNYMAPEVFRGEKYTANVDIYSLGLVMYQLLNANRMPFYPPYPQPITFSAAEQARARRLAGEALPLPSGAQDALGQLVCKACAPDPAQRFASPLAHTIRFACVTFHAIWKFIHRNSRFFQCTRIQVLHGSIIQPGRDIHGTAVLTCALRHCCHSFVIILFIGTKHVCAICHTQNFRIIPYFPFRHFGKMYAVAVGRIQCINFLTDHAKEIL